MDNEQPVFEGFAATTVAIRYFQRQFKP